MLDCFCAYCDNKKRQLPVIRGCLLSVEKNICLFGTNCAKIIKIEGMDYRILYPFGRLEHPLQFVYLSQKPGLNAGFSVFILRGW